MFFYISLVCCCCCFAVPWLLSSVIVCSSFYCEHDCTIFSGGRLVCLVLQHVQSRMSATEAPFHHFHCHHATGHPPKQLLPLAGESVNLSPTKAEPLCSPTEKNVSLHATAIVRMGTQTIAILDSPARPFGISVLITFETLRHCKA